MVTMLMRLQYWGFNIGVTILGLLYLGSYYTVVTMLRRFLYWGYYSQEVTILELLCSEDYYTEVTMLRGLLMAQAVTMLA